MVTEEEIREVADTARISLTADEVQSLAADVDDILDSFAALDEIDTAGVEPSLHPIDHDVRTRPDEEEDCLTQEAALSNAENTEDGYFVGPRSVE